LVIKRRTDYLVPDRPTAYSVPRIND
jgi:hypothetical protein